MTFQGVTAQIVKELSDLPLEKQQKVLAFTRSLLEHPKGIKGSSLLDFAGTIASDQLLQIQEAVEEGCERIDANEW